MPRPFFLVITRRYLWAALVLLGCLIVLAIYSSFPLAVYTLNALPTKIIYDVMLDPGHGGIDPGGIGRDDIYEKEFTLDIALRMRDLLEQAGLRVGMTRDTDRDVSHLAKEGTRHRRDLLGRFSLMNQAQVGMSIHTNATRSKDERGAIVFYMQNSYIDKIYAQIAFDELERVQEMNHSAPVPRNNLFLLKAKPPVILVEIGFITNEEDLQKLLDEGFRQNVAEALSTAILKFVMQQPIEQSEI